MERIYRFLHESLIHLLNRLVQKHGFVQECRYCVLFGDVQRCIIPWLCLDPVFCGFHMSPKARSHLQI